MNTTVEPSGANGAEPLVALPDDGRVEAAGQQLAWLSPDPRPTQNAAWRLAVQPPVCRSVIAVIGCDLRTKCVA
jgi:hypothetical protein